MLNCICIIKFLPISVVLAWLCSGEGAILEPGLDPWLQTFFCLEGKDLFFSQSLKERNLNVKILTEFFCYNPLPILLRAALSNVHSGARLWSGFKKLHPLFYE